MSAANVLLKPQECAMLLVDFQAGLGFGVESIPRQLVVNNNRTGRGVSVGASLSLATTGHMLSQSLRDRSVATTNFQAAPPWPHSQAGNARALHRIQQRGHQRQALPFAH